MGVACVRVASRAAALDQLVEFVRCAGGAGRRSRRVVVVVVVVVMGGGGRDIEGRKGNKKKKEEEGRVGSASTPPVGSENK